jgi:predicted RNase H-like nuclease (RuvC/YqgF family)
MPEELPKCIIDFNHANDEVIRFESMLSDDQETLSEMESEIERYISLTEQANNIGEEVTYFRTRIKELDKLLTEQYDLIQRIEGQIHEWTSIKDKRKFDAEMIGWEYTVRSEPNPLLPGMFPVIHMNVMKWRKTEDE